MTLIARRAGRSRRVPAPVTSDCRAAGTLRVEETGRWFVYVEHGRLESWVPVESGGTARISTTRDLYERPRRPSRSTQAVVALPLLLMAASLLVSASRAAALRPA